MGEEELIVLILGQVIRLAVEKLGPEQGHALVSRTLAQEVNLAADAMAERKFGKADGQGQNKDPQ